MAKFKSLEQQVGTIDIKNFMKKYYGVSHKDIANMTHDVVSTFFPELRRTSITYAEKNPELVSRGNIVLVRDSNNNIAPYIAPEVKLFVEEPQFDISVLIEQIIASLKITSELSESAIILIECQDSLDGLIGKDALKKRTSDLPNVLIEITNDSNIDGVVVSTEGTINKLSLNQYSLEELSVETDSIAIILESDQSITLVVDGVSQYDYDFIMLRTELYSYLDSADSEIMQKETQSLESPAKYSLHEMSDYELTVLMKAYKVNKQFDYYHIVRRELIKRTKSKKQSKRNKVKQKRKQYYREEE